MHFAVEFSRPDQVGLAFDGFAGVLVVAGAVTRDEKRGVLRLRRTGKGMLLHDFASAAQKHVRHAVVSADRAAIIELLRSAFRLPHPWFESQFPRNDFLGEVAFADEEGHDEYTRSEHAAQDTSD